MDRRTFSKLLLAQAGLAACSGSNLVSLDQVNRVGSRIVPILVGTSRNVKPDGTLGSDRGNGLSFGRYDVSVPPSRDVGEVDTSSFGLNPRYHFATVNNELFKTTFTFQSQLRAQLLGRPAGRRDAVVFVHGYNTSYEDGLFRFAQFVTDMELPDVPVHYSWPSAQKLLRYGYDRDSMLFARDGFEQMLRTVIEAGAERVLLVGHSMGTMLIMETLRELAIAGDTQVRNRLSGVILVSPDIDIDVFRSQANRIGTLPRPFVILSSRKDQILKFAAREIYGDKTRLGALENRDDLKGLDVTVVDVTQYSNGLLNHSTGIDSPAFIKIVKNMQLFSRSFGADAASSSGSAPDSFIAVNDANHVEVGEFMP